MACDLNTVRDYAAINLANSLQLQPVKRNLFHLVNLDNFALERARKFTINESMQRMSILI